MIYDITDFNYFGKFFGFLINFSYRYNLSFELPIIVLNLFAVEKIYDLENYEVISNWRKYNVYRKLIDKELNYY